MTVEPGEGQAAAEAAFEELQEHLAAGDVERRLAARAWARAHQLRTDIAVELVELEEPGWPTEAPGAGEVWVVATSTGVCVGWWHERSDGSMKFEEQGALGDVDVGAAAQMWIGPAALDTGSIVRGRLEGRWADAGVHGHGSVPVWLCDDAAVDQVAERIGPPQAASPARGLSL